MIRKLKAAVVYVAIVGRRLLPLANVPSQSARSWPVLLVSSF
jgi:hypothetical protein